MLKKTLCMVLTGVLTVGMLEDFSIRKVAQAETAQESSMSQEDIENTLDISQNTELTWSYNSANDAWVMSIVSAVANPELPDYQGVSAAVPGAYVKGIDTDADSQADVTASNYSAAVNGCLVLDTEATVTSSNGQTYTAATAPVIINTGAAGYSAQENQVAATSNCTYGYINVACGNRGKQSSATDADGNTYYTGDAPDCLVDQKNAIRFVKYNILLGNLPGSTEYFVSTGGSGGGAHAAMVAATSNHSDFYDYEIEQGAVGIYKNEDGTYSTAVTIDNTTYQISDGVWGCVAYSAITSLAEADMSMAFEYYLDTDYSFNTSFQAKLASYLSEEYMEYINEQNLSIKESSVGFDLNDDGDKDDAITLQIEYDEEKYADTNGYGGTYLTLYQKQFESDLEWYLDNLDYASDWTWFDSEGNALSDTEVASMTTEDKKQAFLEGRYSTSASESSSGDVPSIDQSTGTSDGTMPSMGPLADTSDTSDTAESVTSGMGDEVGTPDQGTTQASGSTIDSSNYSTYADMLAAYQADITSVESGDEYGNNQVELYNPLNYIGNEGTEAPTWTRVVMGAAEGDMSLFASLNLQIAWLNAGTDAELEWQWDGGHVPSEIFGESLALYIDQMYGEYVEGAQTVEKESAAIQTENGSATAATGTDISSWATLSDDGSVSMELKALASYRTSGASKATPGFDVMDYGQETYEFGDKDTDARHFDKYVLQALEEHATELSALFNLSGSANTAEETTTTADSTQTSDTANTEDSSQTGDTTQTSQDSVKKGDKITDSSSKAVYQVTSVKNHTVEYVKSTKKKSSSVVIPATISVSGVTYKVTSIAKNAFKSNKYLKKITIGKNVKKIGKQAFYKCKKLKTIQIKTSALTLKNVGKNAFKGVNKTVTVKAPKKKKSAYRMILIKRGLSKKATWK